MTLEKMLNGKAPSIGGGTPLSGGQGSSSPGDGSRHDIRMKKEVGLLEGVAIILGIIIGSGKKTAVV